MNDKAAVVLVSGVDMVRSRCHLNLNLCEESILIAIDCLQSEADGPSIQHKVKVRTRQSLPIAQIYHSLHRLIDCGLVEQQNRCGLALFILTPFGKLVLDELPYGRAETFRKMRTVVMRFFYVAVVCAVLFVGIIGVLAFALSRALLGD